MAASDKDTIYIDIDDEITGIIDKVRSSDGKVVALVLPKRAAVFQSIVNMKLLKRAADSSKKNLVLITAEAGLMPLAGAAGVHVAKTLNSKPEIPSAPQAVDEEEEAVEEDGEPSEAPLDGNTPVGDLAGPPPSDGVETLVLDDDALPPEEAPTPTGSKTFEPPAKKGKGGKKNNKLKVPNFERFRLLLILGGILLILLIGGLVFANTSLAKATINIKTDSTSVDTSLDLNLSTAATKLNESNNTIPAKLVSQQKTYSQQVPTTGQKNNGNKASGSVTVVNCSNSDNPITIPAGTGFSSNGNTYISQQTVTVPESRFSGGSHKCASDTGKASVEVLAQSPGASYNLPANSSFSIALNISGVSGTGATISGGTDNIVQSVNQNDINNAKAKISAANDATMKQTLKSQLQQEHYYAVEATYVAGTPTTTTSASVGEVTNSVTVTETITYSMFGVHQSDLDTLIDSSVKTQIDTDKQSVLDRGLDKAVFNVGNISNTNAQLSLSTKATAGPDLDVDNIRQDAAGKKAGAIKDELKSNPDVTDVDIKVSPFWAGNLPKDPKKITVNIAKPTNTAKAGNANDSNP